MTPRVAVVGAGIVGLATAFALQERGVGVRLYERGAPGNGQSGGHARVFRHGHLDARLVRLACESRAVFDAWGAAFGVELVSRDGAVAIGPSAAARLAVLEQDGGVPARALGADELAVALPVLAPFTGPAMLDEAGGAIRARIVVEALAARLADAIVTDEVIAIRPARRGRVEVRSGGTTASFERVVVCAGAGTAALARGVGLTLPLHVTAHARATFAVRGAPPERLPCLQDSSGAFGEVGVYASALPGNHCYAVGVGDSVAVDEHGGVLDHDGLGELGRRASAYVGRALPGLDPRPIAFRHCWVTELPWSSDGLAVWDQDGVLVVAGHNLFKLAPVLGRKLAQAIDGGALDPVLRPDARLGAAP